MICVYTVTNLWYNISPVEEAAGHVLAMPDNNNKNIVQDMFYSSLILCSVTP